MEYFFIYFFLVLDNRKEEEEFLVQQKNFWLINFNSNDPRHSLEENSTEYFETEAIVKYFLINMYGAGGNSGLSQQTQQSTFQQEQYSYGMNAPGTMNGGLIEQSVIPGSTVTSSSPTTVLQQSNDLYGNNIVSSLRTHSSKFPVSRF